jgi:hypothetical protein
MLLMEGDPWFFVFVLMENHGDGGPMTCEEFYVTSINLSFFFFFFLIYCLWLKFW